MLDTRSSYKPFQYPWAFEFYEKQLQNHWTPYEIDLSKDVLDWENKLSERDKHLFVSILRFFTQADVDVAGGYCSYYLPFFKAPEIRMMLLQFAAMETIHIHSYSLLNDTLGFSDTEYEKFTEYQAMVDKHDYFGTKLTKLPNQQLQLRNIAILSAFGEGLQLFSSFAILMSFPARGLMNGCGQIVSFSIRDESLHVEGLIQVFKELAGTEVWTDNFKWTIYQACREMVSLEDKFIDLAFKYGDLPNLTAAETKEYIRFIADKRLVQLGLKPNYGVVDNPLPWLDVALNSLEHSNFFETRATEYSKNSTTGEWADAFN